jgi:hypothetical protein
MQHITFSGDIIALLTLDGQQILMCGNIDVCWFEASNGQRDPIIIFTTTFDIERRVILVAAAARLVFKQIEQMVETNGAAAIGGEI